MIEYPEGELPDFIMGKQRTENQGYITQGGTNGALYTEQLSNDLIPRWSFQIKCMNQEQARQFFRFVSNTRAAPFVKSILTERGRHDYVVRFIEQPIRSKNISDNVFEYSGSIMAQKIKGADDDADTEATHRYYPEFKLIDVIVNDIWPEA